MTISIKQLLHQAHVYLFRQPITLGMAQFLQQLLYSGTGLLTANVLLFIATLFVGAYLGPERFGRFALTVAAGQLLAIPMMLGMDVAALRGVARERRLNMRRRTVTSGLVVIVIASAVLAVVVYSSAGTLAAWWQLPARVVRLAGVLAVALTARNYLDAVVRGLSGFRAQALVRVIEALTVLGVTVVLIMFKLKADWDSFVGVVVAATVLTSWLYLIFGRVERYLSWSAWSAAKAWNMWRYIRFGLLGAAGAVVLVSADKVLIGRILGAQSLGVYAAYHFLSVQVSLQMSYIFVNVFFPAVSRAQGKRAVMGKMDRLVLVGGLPAALVIMLILVTGMATLGRAYPLSGGLIVGMSLFAVIFFIYQVYGWFITSLGASGVRFTSLNNAVAAAAYLGGIYWLAPRLGLLAPVVSFASVALYLFGALIWWRRHWLRTLS